MGGQYDQGGCNPGQQRAEHQGQGPQDHQVASKVNVEPDEQPRERRQEERATERRPGRMHLDHEEADGVVRGCVDQRVGTQRQASPRIRIVSLPVRLQVAVQPHVLQRAHGVWVREPRQGQADSVTRCLGRCHVSVFARSPREIVQLTAEDRHAQECSHSASLELRGIRPGGVQLVLVGYRQPHVLRQQPHGEGVCGHRCMDGKPGAQEEVKKSLCQRDDVQPEKPGGLLGRPADVEDAVHQEVKAAAQQQEVEHEVAVHLAGRQPCEVAHILAIQDELLHAHVLLLVFTLQPKLAIKEEILAVVAKELLRCVK
mmetsp:Transcript_2216/g.6292  ORF Transcript_2216/g.6292 Transcript_2216/m.6292 type:complete len:314 (+) Transcript_2216:715-1656(+)